MGLPDDARQGLSAAPGLRLLALCRFPRAEIVPALEFRGTHDLSVYIRNPVNAYAVSFCMISSEISKFAKTF